MPELWSFHITSQSCTILKQRKQQRNPPLKFFSVLYQGSRTRIALNVCKHATTPSRSQFSLATSLGWAFPLPTVHPHILFMIDFFNRVTNISCTPKCLWFLHRAAIQITIHLWLGLVQLSVTRTVSGTEKCFHLIQGQKHYKNRIWFLRKGRFLSNVILSFSFARLSREKVKLFAQPSAAILPSIENT